ncbi:hypothetical protein [Massilia sp. 9096]|uniref:hypothetical protein n=1 Tax=Massilia sp. 9096 TaxID=1500894 RepID=UPI0006910579|nr:hypothetical protein [Massilia sp. 9096]
MSTQQGSQDQASTTLGVGGATSGEAGSTLTHETMAETGGSGGAQQTLPKDLEVAPRAPAPAPSAGDAIAGSTAAAPEGAGLDATAIGRGYQDTRSAQAGPQPTGLGTPETGANQDESDLAPPRP